MVEHLARALEADHAFIAELMVESLDRVILLCQTKILASDHAGKHNVMCWFVTECERWRLRENCVPIASLIAGLLDRLPQHLKAFSSFFRVGTRSVAS
ncbi:MAG: hypothetical protein LC647_03860, partial [Beggiatoa sp.]|nr:hypothetical protein [Beggiatoa sp.]